MRAYGWWRWMSSWTFVQSSRACFTDCSTFRTFRTGSRPKQGCPAPLHQPPTKAMSSWACKPLAGPFGNHLTWSQVDFFCHCYLCMPVFSRTPLSWPMKKSKFHATQNRVWTSPRNNSWSKFVGWRHCLSCKPHWGSWSASPHCGRCWWRAGVQIRQCELAVIFMHNLMR